MRVRSALRITVCATNGIPKIEIEIEIYELSQTMHSDEHELMLLPLRAQLIIIIVLIIIAQRKQ